MLHSWLGLIAGLGLLVIGLTGSLLVFHEEIDGLLSPAQVTAAPSVSGRLSYDSLLKSINQALPGFQVSGWRLSANPARADQVYVVKEGTSTWQFVWLDPYTGAVRGDPVEEETTFTGWLLELHYAFLGDHVGMVIVGLFGVLLCLLGITGVLLYRHFWRHFFTLRWGKSARIFFSDLHKMIGISSVAFNLILGFTGAWWNLSHIVEHLIEGDDPEAERVTGRLYADTLSFHQLVRDAETKVPGFRLSYLDFPAPPGTDVTLYGSASDAGPLRSRYGSTVLFDGKSGELKEITDVREAGLWAQFLDSFTPLHFGTFGGLPIKILWCLGGLTPGLLSVSGFMIWYRRRYRMKRGG